MVATVETLSETKLCSRPRGNLCSLSRLCGEKKWSNEFGTRNLEHVDSQEEAYSTGERRLPPPNIDGANTYQFVESNPVDAADPFGLQMHHIIPQSLYRFDNEEEITFSPEAVKVFNDATIDAPYHFNFTKQHFAYNNAVRAAIEEYLADHGICPTKMTTQEAKNLVKAIRNSDNKIIKWFLKGIATTPSFLDKLGAFLKGLTEGTENVPMFIVLPEDILRDLVPQPINEGGPPTPTA